MSNVRETASPSEKQELTSDSNSNFNSSTSAYKSNREIINMEVGGEKEVHFCTVECQTKYPIHHAAKMGWFKVLKKLLDNCDQSADKEKDCDLNTVWDQDECLGRTPLHYAADAGNVEKGFLCTRVLLECEAILVESTKHTQKFINFVNATDYNHETALHLAAYNEATRIVRELLLNQADLNITSYNGKSCLMEVYKKTPLAMNEALHQSISYADLCKREIGWIADDGTRKTSRTLKNERDPTQSYTNVCLNFYPVIGSEITVGRGKKGKPIPETTFLYRINRKRMESDVRRQILKNVLVQTFLHYKWSKVKSFCYFAIFLHIIWLALYIGIVASVFILSCPYAISTGEEHHEHNETEMMSSHLDNKTKLGNICKVNPTTQWISALLLIISVGIAIKELFQFIRLRSLYLRFENFGQCTLLAFIFVSVPNLYLYNESVIDPLHYQSSAFGMFLAWTLFLCQLAKLPRFCIKLTWFGINGKIYLPDHGLYVEILSRVFKNFLIFITIFSSLLISFVMSFSILLPNSTGFVNLSHSMLKVLTMMTGELNYDETFLNNDEELIYPISSHIMYAIFITVATIILFNLLIGFTVSDIQGLQKDAEVNQISNMLEQIFLMECFILSTPMQTVLCLLGKIAGKSASQRDNIMVTRRINGVTYFCFHTKFKTLPSKHRVEIRDCAAQNCVSGADIEGITRSNFYRNMFTRN